MNRAPAAVAVVCLIATGCANSAPDTEPTLLAPTSAIDTSPVSTPSNITTTPVPGSWQPEPAPDETPLTCSPTPHVNNFLPVEAGEKRFAFLLPNPESGKDDNVIGRLSVRLAVTPKPDGGQKHTAKEALWTFPPDKRPSWPYHNDAGAAIIDAGGQKYHMEIDAARGQTAAPFIVWCARIEAS